MYCAECGTANPAGAETCEMCGSPIEVSSGTNACHVCGAPIDEHDRFCRACGQSQSGASAGRYEPGPSFVDDSALQVDPFELPPWLREMSQHGVDGTNGDHPAHARTSVAEQPGTLPPWLDAASAANGASIAASNREHGEPAKSSARAHDESATEFSLISEDDLPEWLRALGDQEFELDPPPIDAVPESPASVAPPAAAASAAPAVSRAWLSRPRNYENEAAAEVASDFSPIETAQSAATTTPTPTRAVNHPATSVQPEPQPTVTTGASSDEAAVAEAPQRLRLITLSAIVIILVILVFFVLSNVV